MTGSPRVLPFADHVGLRIVEAKDGASRLTLAVQPHHQNSQGIVHGGVFFTLADTGMGAALYSTLAAGQSCATIEVKINYFRAVQAGAIECSSKVVHRGQRIATMESELFAGGELVAKAVGTFAVRDARQ